MNLKTILQFFPAEIRLLVLDDGISDVMINADGNVYIDENGRIEHAATVEPLGLIGIQNVARDLGSDIDEQNPMLDSRLPDGSRVAAMLSTGELTVTVRKFNRWYTLQELVNSGTLPNEVGEHCTLPLNNPRTSSSLGAHHRASPRSPKPFSIGLQAAIVSSLLKPRELAVSQPNAVRWEARDAVPGRPAVTVAQLLVAALRHRPDRIVIGEVREPESAYELLQAMNTGHRGTLSTIHADSALDAVYRLANLALAAHSNLSVDFVRAQVARTINYVVHVERGRDGKRRVTELHRLNSCAKQEFRFVGAVPWTKKGAKPCHS